MIFTVDFGSAQTGVGYRFLNAAGGFASARATSGVTAGSQAGMFYVELDPPATAVVIYWDCDNVLVTARTDFREESRLEGFIAQPAIPFISGVNEFTDMAERALAESLAVVGETFTWFGTDYACIIDHHRHVVTTLKSLFGVNRKYPKWGELITVSGKVRQVTKMNGAALVTSPGGMVEEPPFVDDPSDPSLELEFDLQIKR